MNLISPHKAETLIEAHREDIANASSRYHVPTAAIKAILYQEMTMIDIVDIVADLVVKFKLPIKRDSSTGYAQIYGWVALNAANYAVDNGLASYETLGISTDHRLDPANRKDVRKIWRLVNASACANIELATINLIVAADEMLGRTNFDKFSDNDYKLVFTRYNGNCRQVSAYGERAFARYRAYLIDEDK